MSNPSLGQIVNLCKNQKMNQIYVVECHDTKLVDTDQVLNQYPDVEIDALTVEMFSTVASKVNSFIAHQPPFSFCNPDKAWLYHQTAGHLPQMYQCRF